MALFSGNWSGGCRKQKFLWRPSWGGGHPLVGDEGLWPLVKGGGLMEAWTGGGHPGLRLLGRRARGRLLRRRARPTSLGTISLITIDSFCYIFKDLLQSHFSIVTLS